MNTRGFNSTSPVRSLQIIDGVDNASPGLNFALGNFLGASELDLMKVEIIAGASSAFYGPNAFNGVISMQTKSPFQFPGFSAHVKAGERNLQEYGIRYAKVFKNKEGKITNHITGLFYKIMNYISLNIELIFIFDGKPPDNKENCLQERREKSKKLKELLPVSGSVVENVLNARNAIKNILEGEDSRLLLIVGPCSIHDPQAALEYAESLKKLADEVSDKIFVVMRVYFEKPRTTVGWKGLINDPELDGTHKINKGIELARRLLIGINALGLPCATETLDPITPQYLADLISWSAIGARTTESQTHREMASGLSMPVGFKNGTDGGLRVAINAMKSALQPHHFLGINNEGLSSAIQTSGNRNVHLVLRGGSNGPNYDAGSIHKASQSLASEGLPEAIMIDCNHANSGKDPSRQELVLRDAIHQIKNLSLIHI